MSDESQAGDPRENKEETPKNQNATQNKTAENPPSGTPIISSLPFYFKPCPIYVECPKKEEKYSIEWWKTRLEIAGIIAGIGVLVLLWKQYGEMVNATNVAVGQLKAMQRQSDFMQGQLNESQNARILSERAWVSIEKPIIDGTKPNGDSLNIGIKNTGQTPAINVKLSINETGGIPDVDVIETESGMIAPASDLDNSEFIPAEKMRTIAGGKPDYIEGTIWYDDIFTNHHFTQFCWKLEVTITTNVGAILNIVPTAKHNATDDTQTSQTN